jgi:hypothetical protein
VSLRDHERSTAVGKALLDRRIAFEDVQEVTADGTMIEGGNPGGVFGRTANQ